MVDDKSIQQMRDELQSIDDGSTEYEEVYSLFSWFAQKFTEYNKYRKPMTKMTRL
jgi:hypothetical protein